MKDHTPYRERISAFVDGQADARAEAALFRHLAGCADCRSFLRETADLRARIARLRPVRSAIVRRTAPKRAADPLVLAWQQRVPLPIAASVALLLALGFFALSAGTSTSEPHAHPPTAVTAFGDPNAPASLP